MKISMECPFCHKILVGKNDWRGKKAQCPCCKNAFIILDTSTEDNLKKKSFCLRKQYWKWIYVSLCTIAIILSASIFTIIIPSFFKSATNAENDNTDKKEANTQGNNFSKDEAIGIKFSDDKHTLISYPKKLKDSHYTIPHGVTKIGESAFGKCEKLTSVVLPDGLTDIGEWAFQYCRNLEEVNIPDSVVNIGNGAFNFCDKLRKIEIHGKVSKIGNYTFIGCQSLQSVKLPNSVTHIGDGAFSDTGLSDIRLPQNLTYIGDGAFSGGGLSDATIILPDKVTYIGKDAFGCGAACIHIPQGVTQIGEGAFLFVKSVKLSPNNKNFYIDNAGALIDRKQKKILYMPNGFVGDYTTPIGVTKIGEGAFFGCEKLTSVTIREGVTEIGDHAFAHCDNLDKVVLPSTIKNVSDDAFFNSPCEYQVKEDFQRLKKNFRSKGSRQRQYRASRPAERVDSRFILPPDNNTVARDLTEPDRPPTIRNRRKR